MEGTANPLAATNARRSRTNRAGPAIKTKCEANQNDGGGTSNTITSCSDLPLSGHSEAGAGASADFIDRRFVPMLERFARGEGGPDGPADPAVLILDDRPGCRTPNHP